MGWGAVAQSAGGGCWVVGLQQHVLFCAANHVAMSTADFTRVLVRPTSHTQVLQLPFFCLHRGPHRGGLTHSVRALGASSPRRAPLSCQTCMLRAAVAACCCVAGVGGAWTQLCVGGRLAACPSCSPGCSRSHLRRCACLAEGFKQEWVVWVCTQAQGACVWNYAAAHLTQVFVAPLGVV